MKTFFDDLKFTGTLPELEPDFLPAAVWNRLYKEKVRQSGRIKKITVALQRRNGAVSTFNTEIFENPSEKEFQWTLRYIERLVKTLLWIHGGYKIYIPDERTAEELRKIYDGVRAFDSRMMSKIYGSPLEIIYTENVPESKEVQKDLGRHNEGCRIGFDLGGTNRKVAAVMDGNMIFSASLPWDPYFQKDPVWHREKINEALHTAAEHLPRVDCIGGSTAGVIADCSIRISSLFRGIPEDLFESRVSGLFHNLAAEWGVPFEVANDGEVTALAGSISMKTNGVLGISMGTSTAGGYVTDSGCITDWLNELAFVPVDYRADAPADEWSGDLGCGVQYFSQQGAVRLAEKAGFEFTADENIPLRFAKFRKALDAGDRRAEKVVESIGIELGYALAEWSQFYKLNCVLLLGGVTGGRACGIMMKKAEEILAEEFPELKLRFGVPDDHMRSNGQAVAAATLPEIRH